MNLSLPGTVSCQKYGSQKMAKILVTGGNGQLGKALQNILKDEKTLFTDVENMDITDKESIEKVFNEFKPEWLIHGAAYTNVDGCEENPEIADKVNRIGTENLAGACKKHNCRMIYISTDYVFDGKNQEPYTEEDTPNPQSVYGKTKLAGEKATIKLQDSYVLRTSWVYGDGQNFVKTMLVLSSKMDKVRVVNDQFGRPTFAEDLAQGIYDLVKNKPESGTYHISGGGKTISWEDFSRKIFEVAGKKTKVVGITTKAYFAQYPDKKIAPRPHFSVFSLEKSKKAGIKIIDWEDSLKIYVSAIS